MSLTWNRKQSNRQFEIGTEERAEGAELAFSGQSLPDSASPAMRQGFEMGQEAIERESALPLEVQIDRRIGNTSGILSQIARYFAGLEER